MLFAGRSHWDIHFLANYFVFESSKALPSKFYLACRHDCRLELDGDIFHMRWDAQLRVWFEAGCGAARVDLAFIAALTRSPWNKNGNMSNLKQGIQQYVKTFTPKELGSYRNYVEVALSNSLELRASDPSPSSVVLRA